MILVTNIDWLFTDDIEAVERFQPGDGCENCREGNERAGAFLASNPGRKVGLANITYDEHWFRP